MVKKKLLSVALVAVTVCSMIFTGCGSSAENTGNDTGKTDSDAQAGNTAGDVADVADDVEKPEKITIMVDGTFQATLALPSSVIPFLFASGATPKIRLICATMVYKIHVIGNRRIQTPL